MSGETFGWVDAHIARRAMAQIIATFVVRSLDAHDEGV
jgi:hypothetical protein